MKLSEWWRATCSSCWWVITSHYQAERVVTTQPEFTWIHALSTSGDTSSRHMELHNNRLLPRWCLPQFCTTQNIHGRWGQALQNQEVAENCERWGTKLYTVAAYSLWVNGLIEGTNKLLLYFLARSCRTFFLLVATGRGFNCDWVGVWTCFNCLLLLTLGCNHNTTAFQWLEWRLLVFIKIWILLKRALYIVHNLLGESSPMLQHRNIYLI